MKLKVFNVANSRTMKLRKPSLTMNFKNGLITINNGAVALIQLKLGDKMCVAWDEEDKEWYLYKDDTGFPLRKSNGSKETYSLSFNAMRITDAMKEHLPVELVKPTGSMQLSKHVVNDNGKEYWPILLPSFKLSNRKLCNAS